MLTILGLKDVSVEVDLAIESDGYIPNYSKYTTKDFEITETSRVYVGYLVNGVIDGKTFYVHGIARIASDTMINQKKLDAIEASDKCEE